MLECLDDYIGLSYCEGVYDQPASGLFLNMLPGISIESMDMVANDEQVTYLTLWRDVQAAAKSRFYLDFVNKFTECQQLSRDCDYEAIICTEGNLQILAVAWQYLLGNQLMLFRIYSSRVNRYTTIDKDQAEELKDFYQTEYEKFLALAVKRVDPGENCECNHCGGNPEYVTYLP